ncbi:MAG: PilZ domain-containing protein [Candidatus Omnitrophota bacterium]
MPNEGFLEKRKSVRFLISIPLKYAKVGIQQLTDAVTKDISAEGLGLIATEDIPVDTSLNLSLTIPDNGEVIPLAAEVLWSNSKEPGKYHLGLKLKDTCLKPIPLVLRTLSSRM